MEYLFIGCTRLSSLLLSVFGATLCESGFG